MTTRHPIPFFLFLLALWLPTSAWAETDAQGRAAAWQLWQAQQQGQQSGNSQAFQSLFVGDPQMTKRAFVSTVEYATEVFQTDPESAKQAMTFAAQLAGLIQQHLGDGQPSSLIQRIMRNDQTALVEFAQYAIALYPGYAAVLGQPQAQSQPYSPSPGGANTNQNPAYSEDPYAAPGGTFDPNAPYQDGPGGSSPSGPFRPNNATGGPPPNP